MIVREYRIILPFTLDEYRIGSLYSVSMSSIDETGGGDGVQILANEPFKNVPLLGGRFTEGQYTKKIYHLDNKFPSFMGMFLKPSAKKVHEESWNAYPYCKTIVTNPDYMKDGFFMKVETMHCQDRGTQYNALELKPDILRIRKYKIVDIANDPISTKDYNPSEDPKIFKSVKTGRGPLKENWITTFKPCMCAYKVVSIHFKMFAVGDQVEKYLKGVQQRLQFLINRQIFCTMDKWYGMSIQDIRELEATTKRRLDELRSAGQTRGRYAPND